MIASIHQPHYFPWIGYFDKMAKADMFVLLDQVQLEKNSLMLKNRVIDTNGEKKYITITADTKDYLNREYCAIETKDDEIWKSRQLNAVQSYYRKAAGFKEVFPVFRDFLMRDYSTVCQWTIASIHLIRDLLSIDTKMILQSQVDYDRELKRSDLVYGICKAIGADTYFSGRGGSVEYLDRDKFAQNGVTIVFQDFDHPTYQQVNRQEFLPGVSILDMLLNCGIEGAKEKFWESVRRTHEFGQ